MNQVYKGIIALDIDGTITPESNTISSEVVDYFHVLASQQWKFVFLTGRSFQWGFRVSHHFSFPYFLSVQNGAVTIQMPQKQIRDRKYLDRSALSIVEKVCHKYGTDFIIYTGFEYDDQCYYRPELFSPELSAYLKKRRTAIGEKWQAVSSFETLPMTSFASLKCFAKDGIAQEMAQDFAQYPFLHVPLNRDIFDSSYFVLQVTKAGATKGQALESLMSLQGCHGPVIAGGDDYNDFSLLKMADVKVVMATAPEGILKLADVVAPSAAQNGIIQGLQQAIQKLDLNRGSS